MHRVRRRLGVHDLAAERVRERLRILQAREPPATHIPLPLTPSAPVGVLHTAQEGVHGIEPLAETAERDGDLNDMRKVTGLTSVRMGVPYSACDLPRFGLSILRAILCVTPSGPVEAGRWAPS